MERDYSIQLGDLKKKLRHLKSINDGSLVIERDIACLEAAIQRYKSNYAVPYNSDGDMDYTSVVEDGVALVKAGGLLNVLEGLNLRSWDNPFLNRSSTYTTLLLSDSDAVDIVHDFYRTQAFVFYNDFIDIYDSLPNHLQFFKPNDRTDGEMISLNSFRESYVHVPNMPDFRKVTILIHEIQHAIDNVINYNFNNNEMIKETTAMFMELIGIDYVSKRLNVLKDGTLRHTDIHSMVLTDSLYLLDKLEMFRDLGGNHIKDMDDFYRVLQGKDYTKDEVDSNLVYPTESLLTYQLPYLLAIELYYIYKKDKEDALEYLLGIVQYCNDDNIMSVLEGVEIKLGEHYFKYQKGLERQLKKKN